MLLVIVLFCTGAQIFAQKTLIKANKAFEKKDYYTSINLYKEILNKNEDSANFKTIYFKLGECYRFGNYPNEAQQWYEKALKSGYKDTALFYNYANQALINGKNDLAKEYFTKYLQLRPNDNKVKSKIASIEFAVSHAQDEPKFDVSNIKELNSKFSEYSPAIIKNKVVFASARYDEGNQKYIYKYTGQGFSDFYETTFDAKSGKWKDPIKLNGGINSKFNDGTICYDIKTNTAYFMQCNGYKGKVANCNIFYSTLDDKNNKWSESTKLEYSNKLFSTGHPALTSDGNTMYFVSDMPGGSGGKDIWMTRKLSEKEWSAPRNLGTTINTEGNEMFPLIVGDTLLYFASDGHVGFGGLDIFCSKIEKGTFSKPVNIGIPFNSSSDDFGILFLAKDSGMFCSNRPGGVGDDDIYSFKKIPLRFRALGTVVEKYTNKLLENAIVILSGDDGSIDSTLSDNKGEYQFNKLHINTKYTVTAKKTNYLVDSKNFDVDSPETNKEYSKATGHNIDFELTLIAAKDSILGPPYTAEKEFAIPDIYYDFDKWSLRDTSKVSLEKVIKMLKLNPEMKIRINSHTDSRGTDEYNNVLSDNRAQSVVNYLIEQGGIKADRLTSKGWGKTKLQIVDAKTEEEHQKNRRTTFSITNANELNAAYHNVELRKIAEKIHVSQEKTPATKETTKNETATIVSNSNLESISLTASNKEGIVDFRVQFTAATSPVEKAVYKKIQDAITEYKVEYTKQSDGYYKYTIGSFSDINEAKKLLKRVTKIYKDSFIVAYNGDKRVTIEEAKKLINK